jgi:hypothetical protein
MSQVILAISDQHFPHQHPDIIPFLKKIKETFNPNIVVNIGDEIDHAAISFHDKDPDMPFSPSSELEKAIWQLSAMYELFPECYVMESNHGSLIYRRGKWAGIPRTAFKSYNEILQAPQGWRWVPELIVESEAGDIYFTHGHKKNSLANSKDRSMNYVQGHHHSSFDIQYWANSKKVFWGMTIGCLIDNKNIAFNYNKVFQTVPMIGAGLIIDGVPLLVPMKRDSENRWIGIL